MLAAALVGFLLLAAACGSVGQRVGAPGDGTLPIAEPAAEPTAELRRVERQALATQRRMVRVEQEFVGLLKAGDQPPLRRKAVQMRDAYLALADATDRYRIALRRNLANSVDAALFAPYKKQARGLRLAAEGVDDYRTALQSRDRRLASRGLRQMERGDSLMKEAGRELDALTGAVTLAAGLS